MSNLSLDNGFGRIAAKSLGTGIVTYGLVKMFLPNAPVSTKFFGTVGSDVALGMVAGASELVVSSAIELTMNGANPLEQFAGEWADPIAVGVVSPLTMWLLLGRPPVDMMSIARIGVLAGGASMGSEFALDSWSPDK